MRIKQLLSHDHEMVSSFLSLKDIYEELGKPTATYKEFIDTVKLMFSEQLLSIWLISDEVESKSGKIIKRFFIESSLAVYLAIVKLNYELAIDFAGYAAKSNYNS